MQRTVGDLEFSMHGSCNQSAAIVLYFIVKLLGV